MQDEASPEVRPSFIARYSAALMVGLVLYASLYPFTGWRIQGDNAFAFITAPLPRYLTLLDLSLNIAGYVPMGLLLVAAYWPRLQGLRALLLVTAFGSLLSLCMETLQTFLPERVASNVDWGLNTLGTVLGAALALLLLPRLPGTNALYALRKRWFAPEASFGLWLLALWPLALLTPQPLLFGTGNALASAAAWAAGQLQGSTLFTPLATWLAGWQPAGLTVPQQQAVPMLATLAVSLTLMSLTAPRLRLLIRVGLLLALVALGCAASTLSYAMSYSPAHALEWLRAPNVMPLITGVLLSLTLLKLSARWSAALALLCTLVLIFLVNQGQDDIYYALNLQSWQQGRWIRLHGLAQWVAMLWPWVLAAYLLKRLAAPAVATAPAT